MQSIETITETINGVSENLTKGLLQIVNPTVTFEVVPSINPEEDPTPNGYDFNVIGCGIHCKMCIDYFRLNPEKWNKFYAAYLDKQEGCFEINSENGDCSIQSDKRGHIAFLFSRSGGNVGFAINIAVPHENCADALKRMDEFVHSMQKK